MSEPEGLTASRSGGSLADVGFPRSLGTPPTSPTLQQQQYPGAQSSLAGDFLVIGEFSELVGPVPRHVVPKADLINAETLASYILKFMACDFQQGGVGSAGLGAQVQDSQVLLPLPDDSGFAYVHHITLLDVVARGYVRPFC
ncbi:MAG: hypothetical protein Q8P67_00740, partial [archaeon]|nr:hypothetical protein [archaeon]